MEGTLSLLSPHFWTTGWGGLSDSKRFADTELAKCFLFFFVCDGKFWDFVLFWFWIFFFFQECCRKKISIQPSNHPFSSDSDWSERSRATLWTGHQPKAGLTKRARLPFTLTSTPMSDIKSPAYLTPPSACIWTWYCNSTPKGIFVLLFQINRRQKWMWQSWIY